jgi:bifunctional non-homologous end joining protein LigD
MIADTMPLLLDLETKTCPFLEDPTGSRPSSFAKTLRGTHWTDPVLVARVEFRELTSAGRLRAPSFQSFRVDKDPSECLYSDLAPKTAPA